MKHYTHFQLHRFILGLEHEPQFDMVHTYLILRSSNQLAVLLLHPPLSQLSFNWLHVIN